MKLKINEKNKKVVLIALLIFIIILTLIYGNMIRVHILRNNVAKNYETIYENNKETTFSIEKIMLCNSANAIDYSQEKNLQDLSIYQYSDIAIYINNGEELSNKNTIKELYIDNISFDDGENSGEKSLTYKNILNFGLNQPVNESRTTSDLNFNVVKTNQEDDDANYDEPTFYTDCTNPISLEYVNYNILNNYKMEENNSLVFDGSILEKVGISTESLDCKIKFKINIVNNQDEKYSCWVNFKLPLDDIYKGTTMKTMTAKGDKYKFFRH